MAIHYVGRYATTRARLRAYLQRKLGERDWSGPAPPDVEGLIERLVALRYVDDAAFASARAAALQRRGYGERRINQALAAAGIDEAEAAPVREASRDGARAAALRFAERKGIGPFSAQTPDRAAREKAFAAMIRAGHNFDLARHVLDCAPGEFPDWD